MANHTDRPEDEERHAPTSPRDCPASPSGLPPLPYFPSLCRVLGGVTISIVVCYLEIHHSAPEPDLLAPARLRNPPIYLDCDCACEDLGVSRRTLHTALDGIGVWWGAEEQRSAASRAGRDFISLNPSFHVRAKARIRPYAIVGSRAYNRTRTLAIHRNYPRVAQIFVQAGVTTLDQLPKSIQFHCANIKDTSASSRSLDSLPGVLENALNLRRRRVGADWGWTLERRAEQSERMTRKWAERRKLASRATKTGNQDPVRAAVEAGLLPASALKVQRKAGKHLSDGAKRG
jgi:hypothetical protein